MFTYTLTYASRQRISAFNLMHLERQKSVGFSFVGYPNFHLPLLLYFCLKKSVMFYSFVFTTLLYLSERKIIFLSFHDFSGTYSSVNIFCRIFIFPPRLINFPWPYSSRFSSLPLCLFLLLGTDRLFLGVCLILQHPNFSFCFYSLTYFTYFLLREAFQVCV